MRTTPLSLGAAVAAVMLLGACGGGDDNNDTSTTPVASGEKAPTSATCPSVVPATAKCLSGQDSAGAFYLIAMPEKWNGDLVMHAHGGPSLDAPTPARAVEDLERWTIMVKQGYAWAGSTFRQGGVEVRAAAEDTERLRKIFIEHVAKPKLTILHGQSWGGGVAAKAAETYTAATNNGKAPYDGVLLTSGVIAGGSYSYDFRLDLRVVYQYLCNNHPRPTEAAYPLNLGLPAGVTMTSADLTGRVNECLGLNKTAAQRTAEETRKIRTIENVIKIPASSIQSHINWGTFHFQDISSKRTGGASPFGNIGVRYSGSDDDAALNAGVLRYAADPTAAAKFAADTDPNGKIPVPVLTMRGTQDPTAFVEMANFFGRTMTRAGTADHLVQTFTNDNAHSYLSDPAYVTMMSSLTKWVTQGTKPTPASVAAACPAFEAEYGAGCRFLPDYMPAALETRIPPRQRN
ncbi:hypothetical protein [Pigmentiphaga litoralis]|uniref:Pimeloyl-ACP methyl ester carboxylesterase n=1 Tax=Pigmentiphaga litoralis TaxID=516702 RepID=A0A7Y9LKV3_9BURK|nr:hypothetical protein [Pigmentiphaga litoralis]NYE24484.1 pimeloyl-ACP methyl ester carboxylesterase [Pigmentiphaga litoralis]NYE81902.1 pimeloyl-ACP methyl ester carboxylesterase [Pigmentiphaga litoralis]